MNYLTVSIILVVALLLTATSAFISTAHKKRAWVWLANTVTITAINITHKGRGTRLADASFTSRYLVAKQGSDFVHIAICTAADMPLAIVDDMTPTTDQANSDLSYPLPIDLLGMCEDTKRVQAAAAIAVGSLVVPAAAGQVKTLPTSGGGATFVMGVALTAALAQGDLIEIVPCFPIPTTIAT